MGGTALGAEVPGHRQKQLTQTLIVRLLKTHLFTLILDCEKSTEWNLVSDQTCMLTEGFPTSFAMEATLKPGVTLRVGNLKLFR